jgi:membrane-associated phospholipid phosphatase
MTRGAGESVPPSIGSAAERPIPGPLAPNDRRGGPEGGGRRPPGDLIEVGLLLVTGYACHLHYNLIGHLASLRGFDYGPRLVTPLDRAFPYLPLFVHFYQLAYLAPAAVMMLLLARRGAEPSFYRRVLVAFLALLAIHYALYLLLPTSARDIRLPVERLGTGSLGDLVRAQYRLATVWCAWPSLHVSACWLFYRILSRHYRWGSRLYLVWFLGMMFSTVAIKIHYALDGVTGLVIAEGIYRAVWLRLETSSALQWHWRSPLVRALVLAAVPAAVLGALVIGMRLSGFAGPLYTIHRP